MDKSFIMQTAETIRLQLMATTPTNTLLSWGIEQFIGTVYNGMAALAFKVNGRLFDGNVVIAYDEGEDLYDIFLLNCAGTKCVGKGFYSDQLGDIIDESIERGTDIEEYRLFCEQERQRLFHGDFF